MARLINKTAVPAGRQGFTLIELLISIAIIAILSAILLPNFMGARERAKDTQEIQNMAAVKNALRMYYNDNQSYPAGSGDDIEGLLIPKYMPTATAVGYTYAYSLTDNGDGFLLEAYLSSGQGSDFTGSQDRCGVGHIDKLYVVCAK